MAIRDIDVDEFTKGSGGTVPEVNPDEPIEIAPPWRGSTPDFGRRVA